MLFIYIYIYIYIHIICIDINYYFNIYIWVRNKEEKAETFATHLSKVFKLKPREIILEEENKLFFDNITPAILDTPTKSFTINEVKTCDRILRIE